MNILGTIKETYADGPGIRYAIYTAGCSHNCKGCHNPTSWNYNAGTNYQELLPFIIEEIAANPMLTGITISGGDPMEHPEALFDMLGKLRESFPDMDIWVYTGYTLEELAIKSNKNPIYFDLLKLIDTLVDGKFIESLKETSDFRGSSNQRFISSPYLSLSNI